MTNEKKHKTNEVAKTQEAGLPAEFDYSQYAGQGFEAHTRDDYAVPFLGVLQSNSPLVEVSTARAGMLVNTVTQETFDGSTGVIFIPVDTQHVVVEWKPRNQGGGLVAIHQLNSEIVQKAKAEQEFGKWKTIKGDPKSNDLIETFYVYGIFVGENETPQQMIMTFSSTKIKVYKRWMTQARTVQVATPNGGRVNPPLFAHKYRIKTVGEKNADGSYFNFQIEFEEKDATKARIPTSSHLFAAAREFFRLIKEGSVKAAYDSQTETGAEPKVAAADAEIPFE